MMRHTVLLVLSCFAVLSLAACAPPSTSNAGATYQAVPLKGDPRVAFNAMTNTLTVDITSPTGIGSTRIEKTTGQWPPKIVMRLHVKGLESFKFRYADTIIDVNVSSHGDQTVTETYQQGGQTSTLSAGDPYWIAVTRGPDYFDLEAPANFFKGGENKFTIEWIDFYR
jgi:hypothetical protein